MFRANGIDVYSDLVTNQRGGGSGAGGVTFSYADADGQVGGGRFPKNPENFHPNVPEDPNVPGPDFSFGSDLAPINGKPKGYIFHGLIDSADWMTRSLDVQGYRIDDAKGQSSDFLLPFLNSKAMAGKFAVAEYFDGNIGKIQDWVFNRMRGRPSAFDFPTRFTLAGMCNSRPFNMAVLDHVGLAGSDPLQAVTFVENHDTDRSEPIFQNKIMAYAYILTSEGYPCVFYKDYSTDKFCFGLKPEIDNLIFIHEQIANGDTLQRFKDFDVFAYERLAGAHLLVGLNNDPNVARTITVFTGFGANVELHDYTGHSGDVRTNGGGQVTITIPRNVDGLGYVCYSRMGIGKAFHAQTHAVKQTFEGAQDLDIKPAATDQPVEIGRIFCEIGKQIRGALKFDATDWTASTTLTLELLDPSGISLSAKVFHQGDQGEFIAVDAVATGFHTFRIQATNTPATNLKPSYSLETIYQAPKSF